MRADVGLVCALLLLAGCRVEPFEDVMPDAAGAAGDARWIDAPPAMSGVVPQIGGEGTLDVGCWNVENFPKGAAAPEAVADLIASMDLDIVAVVEINDSTQFQSLVARLPGWVGVLGSGNPGGDLPQKLGFLWNPAVVTVENAEAVLTGDTWKFPRAPFQAKVTSAAGSFTLMVVHLKAGVTTEDQERRRLANVALETHVRGLTGGALVCGDFNQPVYQSPDAGVGSVYTPWLADSARYRVLTGPTEAAGAITYLDFGGRMLDQMISNAALDGRVGAATPIIPPLDEQYSIYESSVSDHLPVVLRLGL